MESQAPVAPRRAATSSLPVARSGLGVALGPEGRPVAGVGVGVGPAGRGGDGAAGRGGEAGTRLEGAGGGGGGGGAAVGSGLGGLSGVGLGGRVAAPRELRRLLLRRQLRRLPGEGGGGGRGGRLAVGRELLGLLRGGLLLAVAGWKGKERGGVRETENKGPRPPAEIPLFVCLFVYRDKRKARRGAHNRQTKNELRVFLPFT